MWAGPPAPWCRGRQPLGTCSPGGLQESSPSEDCWQKTSMGFPLPWDNLVIHIEYVSMPFLFPVVFQIPKIFLQEIPTVFLKKLLYAGPLYKQLHLLSMKLEF